jgi:hypothetical protein
MMIRPLVPALATLVLLTAGPAVAADATLDLGVGDGFAVRDSTLTERFRVDENGDISIDGARFLHKTGDRNTFLGEGAGASAIAGPTGADNAALGQGALDQNTSGQRNVAIGKDAGQNQTTGSDNIYVSNSGIAAESGQIRIGTQGTHTDAFVAGIDGNVVAGSAVLVTASGELGVAASSRRFKQDVTDMAGASAVLLDLRPVTFRYREGVGGSNGEAQYGLIAEEVAAVAPGLVAFERDGTPFSVHYEFLAPMLLNEVQRQQRTIEAQASQILAQHSEISALAERLAEIESRLVVGDE